MEKREIKFRAWDNTREVMMQPSITYSMQDGMITVVEDYHQELNPHEWDRPVAANDLMPFTGLYDKRGKEVYVADIVKFQAGEPWLIEEIGEDRDGQGFGYCFSPYGSGNRFQLNRKEASKFDVIGNVYEHPNLLNCTPQPVGSEI